MMGAGPWDWHSRSHDTEIEIRVEPRREIRVEVRPERRPQVLAIAPVEVAPYDLRITAFQSRSTVLIFASGSNRTGGFCTALRSLDHPKSGPRIQLSNVAPILCETQAITPFSINAALHVPRTVSKIDVLVGDRYLCIPVEQVAGIS